MNIGYYCRRGVLKVDERLTGLPPGFGSYFYIQGLERFFN